MQRRATLTSYYKECYKSLFSPLVRKIAILSEFPRAIIRRCLLILKPQVSSTKNGIK